MALSARLQHQLCFLFLFWKPQLPFLLLSRNCLVNAVVEGEMTQEDVRRKELAIQKLSVLYSKASKHTELAALVQSIRPLMAHFSKAKCGKLFR